MNPTISIVNRSRTVSNADVKRNLNALQKQITRDFEPAWGWGANLRFEATKFDMKIVIKDHAKGGDLGFHIEGGKPVGYIYAKDDIESEREYTSTLSHELLEMIADPNVNLYAAGPFRFKGRRRVGFFAFEVCDPVQENYYKIDGVRVQDFVLPEWFEEYHKKGSMKTDHMGVLDAPFTLAEGGYTEVFSRGRWHSLTGPKARPKPQRHRLLTRMSVLRNGVLPPASLWNFNQPPGKHGRLSVARCKLDDSTATVCFAVEDREIPFISGRPRIANPSCPGANAAAAAPTFPALTCQ